MIEFLSRYNLSGLFVGLCTFLIIGLFHPLVIKGEYYFGEKCKWWFMAAGCVFLVMSLLVSDFVSQCLLGVTSFSCFWSILEVKEQVERVRKGWFPANPARKYNRFSKSDRFSAPGRFSKKKGRFQSGRRLEDSE